MRFLIAGLGSIGRRHLRNLVALGEQDIILYRTGKSTLPGEDLVGFRVETDLKQALSRKPDAVVISNPTAFHLDVAIPAAFRGCHLLLEKSVSHSIDRIDELEQAVEQGKGRVLVGYHYRFHPGLQQVANVLQSGALGRVVSVGVHWGQYLPGWHPWEDYRQGYSARADLGGGVVLTLSHPFDYLRWLVGEVVELWAFAGRLSTLDVQVEDTAEVGLRFANGALGAVHLDYVQQPPAHNLVVVGTEGTILWDYDEGAAKLYSASSETWERLPFPEQFERNDLYMAEMRHFLDVCHGQAEPICSLKDGIRALEISLRVLESQEKGEIIRFDN